MGIDFADLDEGLDAVIKVVGVGGGGKGQPRIHAAGICGAFCVCNAYVSVETGHPPRD